MSQNPIKFAYWVPNVSGGLVVSQIEQRTSWDIDYNRKLAQIAERAMTVHELQIVLNVPLSSALVADWRKQPLFRLAMRLPWRMSHNNMVRVNLEPFDQPPDVIHRTFLRMWRYYRS